MASTSYDRIQNVAEKHANEICTHAYELHGDVGVRRCLLGWMAADSGVRLPNEIYNTHVLGMEGTGRFIREMQSEYGMSLDQLRQLQRANDESKSAAQLMELLSGLMETWSARPVPSGERAIKSPVEESFYTKKDRAIHIERQVWPGNRRMDLGQVFSISLVSGNYRPYFLIYASAAKPRIQGTWMLSSGRGIDHACRHQAERLSKV